MKHFYIMSAVKNTLRKLYYQLVANGKPQYHCPLCDYRGIFKNKKLYMSDEVRVSTKCLGCNSKERHRLMHLYFAEFHPHRGDAGESVLHIAPEKFLQPLFREKFPVYHTADLFMDGVDFKEDLQKMSFPDGTYDCIIISRVLTCPPDIEACVREIRRVLKPGGRALIGEIYTHEKTIEFGKFVGERHREIGVDLIDLFRAHFRDVDLIMSDRYAEEYQLHNRITKGGKVRDDYPELVRIPGVGFKDVLAVCRA